MLYYIINIYLPVKLILFYKFVVYSQLTLLMLKQSEL